MKINADDTTDSSQINLNQTRAAREASDAAASGPSASGRAPGADSIALSGLGALVQQTLNSGSDARTARVQELKQQLDSGQYPIDPVAVSQALIAAHLSDH